VAPKTSNPGGGFNVKRSILGLSAIILALAFGQADIRCGNDFISPGDSTFEVTLKMQKCGEIVGKENVGKETTTTKEYGPGRDTMKTEVEKMVERWYVRVQEHGGKYCYPLTFEEGILKKIGNWKQCN
jgi:hypothetical protein